MAHYRDGYDLVQYLSTTDTGGDAHCVTLPDNCTFTIRANVIARRSSDGLSKRWLLEGLYKRTTGAATQLAFTSTPTGETDTSGWSAFFRTEDQFIFLVLGGDPTDEVVWSVQIELAGVITD